jgi:hypothetical protein
MGYYQLTFMKELIHEIKSTYKEEIEFTTYKNGYNELIINNIISKKAKTIF